MLIKSILNRKAYLIIQGIKGDKTLKVEPGVQANLLLERITSLLQKVGMGHGPLVTP